MLNGRFLRSEEDIVERVIRGSWIPEQGEYRFDLRTRLCSFGLVMESEHTAFRLRGLTRPMTELIDIGFVLEGEVEMTTGGKTHVFAAGSIYVIPSWNPPEVLVRTGVKHLLVRISRERLRDRGVRSVEKFARFDPDSALAPLLRVVALEYLRLPPTLGKFAQSSADRVLEDLIVGMLLETGGFRYDPADINAGIRARALSIIAAEHRDPELDPGGVAERMRMSLRQLQRVFQDEKPGLSERIGQARVRSAAEMLSAPGAADLSVNEIARRVGFGTGFRLRAALRREFNSTPSEYRRGIDTLPGDFDEPKTVIVK